MLKKDNDEVKYNDEIDICNSLLRSTLPTYFVIELRIDFSRHVTDVGNRC
jgi:hypothetical protein